MILKVLTRPPRNFISEELTITSWEVLLLYFEDLKNRSIETPEALKKWILDRSELEAVLEEDMAWRYIKMNIDTTDEQLQKDFHFFVQEIEPKIAPFSNEFDKKLLSSKVISSLDEKEYHTYLRGIQNRIKLFREENIELLSKLQTESQEYGTIAAKMSVEHEGKQLTMQQAAIFLQNTDRNIRELVYKKLAAKRIENVTALDELFDRLKVDRQKVAENAGFENFRDYKMKAMGRFDYTVADCENFQNAIAEHIVPIVKEFNTQRKSVLKLQELRPWDLDVDTTGKPALKPFKNSTDLVDKTITCFNKINPEFGNYIAIMNKMGHLDLESKTGKAPGGFNYPLYEIGVPFIYMNAVGTHRDMVTMVHEGGHAIHSFLSRDLELCEFKSTPSEVAELASMSMELISMEHWDVFFDDAEELKRAKKKQLETVISLLPWIATVDEFQHWLYVNTKHNKDERTKQWNTILDKYSTNEVAWDGFEENRSHSWKNQLHIFEVPFYYIEYGMAQLGAIAMWRNYKQDPQRTIKQYEAALKLGYTKTIGEIYQTAGIQFDFSPQYVKELAAFVKQELEAL